MFTPSSERVLANSSAMVTDSIRRRSEVSAHYYKDHLEEIEHRLWELDREWDVERALQVCDATATLVFFVLWLVRFGSWWMFLLFVVQVFSLVHALQGWSPVLLLLRYLGFRTQGEIEWERFALKDLRTMALPPGSLSIGTLAVPASDSTPAPAAPVAASTDAPAPVPGIPLAEIGAPLTSAPAAASAEPGAPAIPAPPAPVGGEAPAPPPTGTAPQVKPVEGLGSVEIQI